MSYSPPTHVAVINRAKRLDDSEVEFIVEAARRETVHCAQAWSLDPPGVSFYPKAHVVEPGPDVAAVYFVDSAGDPDAFAYHTIAGRTRFAYVDVGMCLAYGEPISRAFFHELLEMLVDADLDRWVGPLPDGSHVAVEVCDPVQRDSYPIEVELFGAVKTVEVASFVLPSWFDPGARGPYDYRGQLNRPLSDAIGGYHLVERNGLVVTHGELRAKSFGRTLRRLTAGRERG